MANTARAFPTTRRAVDLDYWNVFEMEFPDTFISTYAFWVRKPTARNELCVGSTQSC